MINQQPNPTHWITTAEAADLTGYDLTHIRRLAREGRIKGTKVSRDWMIHRESIRAYAAQMQQPGPSEHALWRTGARRKNASPPSETNR